MHTACNNAHEHVLEKDTHFLVGKTATVAPNFVLKRHECVQNVDVEQNFHTYVLTKTVSPYINTIKLTGWLGGGGLDLGTSP